MLRTHYRQPIDWTVRALEEAEQTLLRWYEGMAGAVGTPDAGALAALDDDLGTPAAIARLHQIEDEASRAATLDFLGFSCDYDAVRNYDAKAAGVDLTLSDELRGQIEALIVARNSARASRDWALSDRIRDELSSLGVAVKDSKDGSTWEFLR
jgi:cysteinyl-tRNA synthetase